MNKKRVIFTPVETVTFVKAYEKEVGESGETERVEEPVDFTFNNYAFMQLVNEFGDINKLYKEYQTRPYDLTAIFLYSGVKPNQTDFTLEEAREIVVSGGSVVLDEVSSQVTKFFVMRTGDEGKEAFLKAMEKEGMLEVGKKMLRKSN